jgi:hypothetical protein
MEFLAFLTRKISKKVLVISKIVLKNVVNYATSVDVPRTMIYLILTKTLI